MPYKILDMIRRHLQPNHTFFYRDKIGGRKANLVKNDFQFCGKISDNINDNKLLAQNDCEATRKMLEQATPQAIASNRSQAVASGYNHIKRRNDATAREHFTIALGM